MTKEVQETVGSQPEQAAGFTKRSAVLAALSFLAASMGVSLNNGARASDKQKSSEKLATEMDTYIRSRSNIKGSTGPSAPAKPVGGASQRK